MPFRTNLTISERVVCQRAIEGVFWRHRIWPKDNQRAKPSLDAVIPTIQLQAKVHDYLRKSQLVAEQRGRPVNARELQAEIERMVSHTNQPDVLREIFAALHDDPFLIAECLARPTLIDRLIGGQLKDGAGGGEESAADARRQGVPASQKDDAVYTLPKIKIPSGTPDNAWTSTSTVNAPDGRISHTTVWTGSEMIIWGGFNNISGTLNTGARYSPSTDSWASTSIGEVTVNRTGHTAVWTGSEMIVWGGGDNASGDLNSGTRYDPVTDTWSAITTTNAPVLRDSHSAVWTGTEMIVWGGWGGPGCSSSCMLNSGGRYNPQTDSWSATSTANAPAARWRHTAIWTGNQMIVWGGTDQTNYLHTGGRYNPATDSWTATSLVNVPPGRIAHTAVWTGSEMIVWGGVDETFHDTNTGGRLNPSTDSWVATNLTNAPSLRDTHSAVWTGGEMIIWGGESPTADLNTGARYNPVTNSWVSTATTNAPVARGDHTAVWTGNEMTIWGGISFDAGFVLNSGGRYYAQPSTPQVQSVVSRKTQGSMGNFDVNLPVGESSGIECRSGGATGDYTIVVTFLADVSINANPQATVTSGIGTIGSGGAGNGGAVVISGNVVTIRLTNVVNAQTINITLNNVNGSTNVTIPMRMLIGDVNGNGTVNATDVALTKVRVGQAIDAANFRADVNCGGAINAGDVSMVKSMVGTAAP